MKFDKYIVVALTLIELMFAGCTPERMAGTGSSQTSDRLIAITLDDAPLPAGPMGDWDRAEVLISGLDDSDVQVAFFATTQNFEKSADGKERVRRYGKAGHLIANHTHTHPWLHQTQAIEYLHDVAIAERLLDGLPNRRPWFRYPFLDQGRQDFDKREAVRNGLRELGLADAYVTADTYDWHFDRRWNEAIKAGKIVDETALEKVYVDMVLDAAEHAYGLAGSWLMRQPVHVLLLHENDSAASFLPAAIKALRANGWTIVEPDLAYENTLPQPRTSFTGMGRVASLAQEAGARGAEVFDHWSASETGIDARLEAAGAIE